MFGKKDKIIAELLKDNEINSDKIKALTMATNLQLIFIVAIGLMVILVLHFIISVVKSLFLLINAKPRGNNGTIWRR